MHKIARLGAAFGFAAAFILAGCGANTPAGTASIPSGPNWNAAGTAHYHQLHYAYALGATPRVAPLYQPYVPYLGGQVLLAPKFYLIFWDYKKYGDPNKLEPLLIAYTQSMGGSSHNEIETQYYEKSHGKKKHITNPADQYGGSWDDEAPIAKNPTDAQVAAEALKAVAHFGYDPNGVYVVATPHNHSEADFGSVWCSYHSETYDNKELVPYANLPYMTDATENGKKCGADIVPPPPDENGKDEGMTIFAGHEYGESITDPDAYTAWWGVNGEIADPCIWVDMANDQFGTKSYTMQSMTSDATETCVQTYP
jgi:hypothetical protein